MRPFLLILVALGACADPNEAAGECDDTCPVGTAPAKSAEVREAIDLDVSFDPATYAGELAFSRVGEGSCELMCLTIDPCPDGTFPVVSEDCFTCGLINPETGAVDQGSCSDL